VLGRSRESPGFLDSVAPEKHCPIFDQVCYRIGSGRKWILTW